MKRLKGLPLSVLNFDSFSSGLPFPRPPATTSPLILIYPLLQCPVHPLWRQRERTCFSDTHRSQALSAESRQRAASSAQNAARSPTQPSGSPAHLHVKRKWRILANYVLEWNDGSFSPGLSFSCLTPSPFHPVDSDLIFPFRLTFSPGLSE